MSLGSKKEFAVNENPGLWLDGPNFWGRVRSMVNLGDYSFCKLRGWAHIRHEGTFHWLDLDLKAQAEK